MPAPLTSILPDWLGLESVTCFGRKDMSKNGPVEALKPQGFGACPLAVLRQQVKQLQWPAGEEVTVPPAVAAA